MTEVIEVDEVEEAAVQDLITSLQDFVCHVEVIAKKMHDVYVKYPHRMKEIQDRLKGQLSPRLQSNLLGYAKGSIITEMITDTGPISNVLKSYDVNTQQHYYVDKEKIDVYEILPDGQGTKRKLDIFQMDKNQREMVFDTKENHIRDITEQAHWVGQQNLDKGINQVSKAQSYVVKEEGIVIIRPSKILFEELVYIMKEIKRLRKKEAEIQV